MTLIELLVVMSIIMVLAAMVVTGVSSAKKSAKRTQCLSQMRALGQAALLYAQSEGISGSFPFTNAANNRAGAFGLLYNPVDFNDLDIFICPLQRNKEILPPDNATKLFAEEHGNNISYWFVNDGGATAKPQSLSFPMNNILLLERPNGAIFDDTCNHETLGGSAFFISGKCKVIGKNKKALPENLPRDGDSSNSYAIYNKLYR